MIYSILMIFGIVIVDQATKYFAQNHLQYVDTIPLIQDVFHLTYRRNTGAAFSIMRDKQTLLIAMTSIIIIILIWYLLKITDDSDVVLLKIPLTFIIGGALGNLIDRIKLNYVIDFFDFNLINYPVFNIADIFIVVGTFLLAYAVIFKKVEI